MDYEIIKKENQLLQDENERLKKELLETKEHLKKYTAPEYKKVYYENKKEEIKQNPIFRLHVGRAACRRHLAFIKCIRDCCCKLPESSLQRTEIHQKMD